MHETPDVIALEILDVIPTIMRVIRREMRSQRSSDLTVPQFRSLLFIHRNPGCSLLSVADHLGLTSPTVCKMVDGLVENDLVARDNSRTDRRKVILSLTSHGTALLEMARGGTLNRIGGILAPLTPYERDIVYQAIKLLQPLFLDQPDQVTLAAEGVSQL